MFPLIIAYRLPVPKKKIIRREYATRRTATLGLTTWIKWCAPKYHSPQISFIKCETKGERRRRRRRERERGQRNRARKRRAKRGKEGTKRRRTTVPTAARYTRNAYEHLD